MDLRRDRTVCTTLLGPVKKNGKMLNVMETHDLVCKKIHSQITIAHESITDVIMTKYIFNYIFQKVGRFTILKIFFV